jgi:hypothetical protein
MVTALKEIKLKEKILKRKIKKRDLHLDMHLAVHLHSGASHIELSFPHQYFKQHKAIVSHLNILSLFLLPYFYWH